MSDQTNFEVRLYSPRWGHEDAYHMQLERHQLSVRVMGNRAVCSWVEGFDPEWLGHSGGSGNPLEKILARIIHDFAQNVHGSQQNNQLADTELKTLSSAGNCEVQYSSGALRFHE